MIVLFLNTVLVIVLLFRSLENLIAHGLVCFQVFLFASLPCFYSAWRGRLSLRYMLFFVVFGGGFCVSACGFLVGCSLWAGLVWDVVLVWVLGLSGSA